MAPVAVVAARVLALLEEPCAACARLPSGARLLSAAGGEGRRNRLCGRQGLEDPPLAPAARAGAAGARDAATELDAMAWWVTVDG